MQTFVRKSSGPVPMQIGPNFQMAFKNRFLATRSIDFYLSFAKNRVSWDTVSQTKYNRPSENAEKFIFGLK